MSFAPYLHETSIHQSLREQAGRFAKTFIAPNAHTWEEAGEFPRSLYKQAAEAGLTSIGYPEEVGGAGGDFSHVLAASEAMVLEGKSIGTIVGLGSHIIALPPLVHFGTDYQKNMFVRATLNGDKIAALAITEPDCGSDVAAIKTRATMECDHFIVHGRKMFITSGCRADFVVAAVRTGGEGHQGISLLLIEKDTPGFHVSKKLQKMGWWASDTAELVFDHCRVPKNHLIGELHAGFVPIMMNFATERLMLAGNCVAIAMLAYNETVRYARERIAFGKPLSGFQITRHKLADMATRITASRALLSDVLQRHIRGEHVISMAAMAKNTASDMCSWVCDQAVQIHGGMGYMRETVVERLYRDARLYPIGGGTREIMNEIICKQEQY